MPRGLRRRGERGYSGGCTFGKSVQVSFPPTVEKGVQTCLDRSPGPERGERR